MSYILLCAWNVYLQAEGPWDSTTIRLVGWTDSYMSWQFLWAIFLKHEVDTKKQRLF